MQYVANGYGLGVTVNAPETVRHAGVRMLPLEGFDPLDVAALWHGKPSPLLKALLEEGQRYVRATWPAWACPAKLS